MESVLSALILWYLVAVGFLTHVLLISRWALKEVGKFIRFCRRWNKKPGPLSGIPPEYGAAAHFASRVLLKPDFGQ